MINLLNINDIKESDENYKLLRKSALKFYRSSKRLVKESYDYELNSDKKFYDSTHLSELEHVIYETANYLRQNITYISQIKECDDIIRDLYMGDVDFVHTCLVESVVNDVAYTYFVEDADELKAHEGDCMFHCEFIIRKFKGYVTILSRILRENKVGLLYK